MYCYIALDVGGTGIKAAVISENGQFLTPINHYPSNAKEEKEIILEHLCTIITSQIMSLRDVTVLGVGLAFPGPFDYKKGICLIQNINKYDSLYGICLSEALHHRLFSNTFFKKCTASSFNIRFSNDASLYALGETVLNPLLLKGKILCLCIGTGLGSAFLEEGQLVTKGNGIPINGWVYHVPFMESIIDDYISARGITKLYKELSAHTIDTIKDIADLALAEDPLAKKCFSLFGERFALAISSFIKNFQPSTVILGGQIAKSYPLFSQHFLEALPAHEDISIILSTDTSRSTLLGVLKLFNSQEDRSYVYN